MLETILARIGLPLLITFVSGALKQINTPVTKSAAKALEDVDKALKAGDISPEAIAESNRHMEALSLMKSEEYREAFKQVNESLRTEIASSDKYIRRMRPTFGYLMAITWAAQMLGVAYIMIFDTQRAGYIMSSMSSLSAIWAVGLSVLGIYVYKRSEDKKLVSPETIFWNASR
ncbi:MAG TPA: 3TM-type holin [Alphaproteobacteria bacterium]|nr:ribokinase [Alphaproteobacteria bacterium]USO04758.1 MAG: ribokinase [Rhodospirillales bacterium]HOO81069.1 3TM-type holin [Alphaproteobacteria bacterium]